MIAVIVPIYNTEKYLRETIDSVICQTLSFAEHIRLILLDDASTDAHLPFVSSIRSSIQSRL